MMLTLNFAAGLVAAVLMALVLRGSAQYVIARRRDTGRFKRLHELDSGDLMRLGIGVWHLKGLIRVGYYDVWFLALHFAGVRETGRGLDVAAMNTLFCLMAAAGATCILAAFYFNIPDDERGGYNWLTSPWHPRPPPMRWFR